MMNLSGAELRAYREERGLSQRQLAKELGVSQQSISAIERGLVPAEPKSAEPRGHRSVMWDSSGTIHVSMQGIPPSLNRFAGRENAQEYRKAKKEWSEAVAWLVKGKLSQPYDKATVAITYYFADRRRHDPDNYAGKFLLDGLTQGGVIADDSFDHITLILEGMYDHDYPHTDITVTPAQNI